MASLKEFIAEQAERLRTQEPETAKKRDEWVAAVDRLNERIRGWLTQADPNRILEIRERPYEIREEGLGTYTVRGLSIGLGPREVRIEPVARNVAGPVSSTGVVHVARAYGRVDLTDGLKKFMVFRVEKDPEEWSLIEQDGFRLEPFSQSSFEAAFQSLLE